MWFGTQLSWFFLSSWKLLFHCQPHTKIVSQPCSPSPTVAEPSESDKHMERVQCKLTPCFRLSLAWSATSDTITKAAATQTEKGRQKKEKKKDVRFVHKWISAKTQSAAVSQQLIVGKQLRRVSVSVSEKTLPLWLCLWTSQSSSLLVYLECPRILWNRGRGCSDNLEKEDTEKRSELGTISGQ